MAPAIRKENIARSMKATGLSDANNPFLQQVGIEIVPKQLEVRNYHSL